MDGNAAEQLILLAHEVGLMQHCLKKIIRERTCSDAFLLHPVLTAAALTRSWSDPWKMHTALQHPLAATFWGPGE